MPAQLKLYGHKESGHSYKVKLALTIGQIPHEYEAVDIFLPRNQRPEPFKSLSAFGEVPVLVLNGVAHAQSNAILILLAEHTKTLGGESAATLAKAREWLFWEANRVGFSLAHLRFARQFAPQVVDWLQARFDADIARLAQEFLDGRPFILGDRVAIADFALCAYAFFAEQARVQLPIEVQDWLLRIRALKDW
jgi:glutathione S-transferase